MGRETILTREEVMEILKIGRSTFYKLLYDGELKGYKEGNRFKIPLSSVDAYIARRMNQNWQNRAYLCGTSFLLYST